MSRTHKGRCLIVITSSSLNYESGVVTFYNMLPKYFATSEYDVVRYHMLESQQAAIAETTTNIKLLGRD